MTGGAAVHEPRKKRAADLPTALELIVILAIDPTS
jgi:hypothetical protein